MRQDLEKGQAQLALCRQETVAQLAAFARTDVLLFWSRQEALRRRQEALWAPLIAWAKEVLQVEIVPTDTLEVPEENETFVVCLRAFLSALSDRELTAVAAAAFNMRSVLSALALVKGRINAEEAFQAAWLEELWQAEKWGIDEEAEARRQACLQALEEVETFVKSGDKEV